MSRQEQQLSDALDVLDLIVAERAKWHELDQFPSVEQLHPALQGAINPYEMRRGGDGPWVMAGSLRSAVANVLDVSENKASQLIRDLAASDRVVKTGESTATKYTTVTAKRAIEDAAVARDAECRAKAAKLEAAGVPIHLAERRTDRYWYSSGWSSLADVPADRQVSGVKLEIDADWLIERLGL